MTLTPEEEIKLKELRRKKAKAIRDLTRKRAFSPRLDLSVQKEGKQE